MNMKVAITSIELKSPFMFFSLSILAFHITNQLKSSNCIEFKKKGSWKKHYTMTLWRNENDMKAFVYSDAHIRAIKNSKKITKEIRTLTIEAYTMPSWKGALVLLENTGKSYLY